MSSDATVLDIRELAVDIEPRATSAGARTAHVLRGVDLQVKAGRIVGLVGETGAGKSMTASAIMGLLPNQARVAQGQLLFGDVNLLSLDADGLDKIRGARIGYVSQNPRAALEPVRRIGDQIVRLIQAHKPVSQAQAREAAVQILAAVGIADAASRARAFPHELSGGMAQRVVIAMALVNEPELVIADEPTTGLDVTVQAQVLDLLQASVRERGAASLIITHDLGVVAQYCDDIAVMYAGRVIESGSVTDVFDQPAHPYTRRLIAASRSRLERTGNRRSEPPSVYSESPACAYADRCELRTAACELAPESRAIAHTIAGAPGGLHRVRCHLAEIA